MQLPRRIRLAPTNMQLVDQGLQIINEEVARVVDGNISLGRPVPGAVNGDGQGLDNVAGAWGMVPDTGAADIDFTVTHNLGRIPVGWLVVKQDKATSIYTGVAAWTNKTITLRSSTANVSLTLFVI